MSRPAGRLFTFLLRLRPLRNVVSFLDTHSLPGFEGLSVWRVTKAFVDGLRKSSLADRAAVATFRLTLAIFPALLFFSALIPFVPIPRLDSLVVRSFGNLMPSQFAGLLQEALRSLLRHPSPSLLSVSLLAALFFGSNSILGLMEAMNKSAHIHESRPRWRQRLIALGLLVTIFLMTLLAVSLVYGTTELLRFLKRKQIIGSGIRSVVIGVQIILLYVQMFVTISLIYVAAPAQRLNRRFFSPGAVVAANACFVASLALSYFFNNLGNYNKIYGTIGSIPIVLLWIYVNCIVLLVGFELNASIYAGRKLTRCS